jgi:hypothetical protein
MSFSLAGRESVGKIQPGKKRANRQVEVREKEKVDGWTDVRASDASVRIWKARSNEEVQRGQLMCTPET